MKELTDQECRFQLDQIRHWLKNGAIIMATNPHGLVLQHGPDGVIGGLTVTLNQPIQLP